MEGEDDSGGTGGERRKRDAMETGEETRESATRSAGILDLDRNKSRLRPDFKAQDYKN